MNATLVATVAGAPVPVDEVDAAEARLRNGPRADALPASGTSEGRQLRRWLTQLIVTERVVAAEAAARGLTATGAPTEAELLPDVTARLEIGSVAAAALADSRARALFADVTADVRVSDDEVADFHARNPLRFAPPRPGTPRLARPVAQRSAAGTGAARDHRASAGRRAAARLPGVAGRAPGSAGRTGPRLRASRRPAPTRQHPPALMLTLCLDIGGTKIAAGLADPEGALVHTATRPTPADRGAEQVWAAVDAMIADALGAADGPVAAVGIASSGPVHLPDGTVSPINIPAWRGFPLRDRVAAALPGVPVRLGGDGVCMALGEHWRGAGRGARFLLGMVVSTGVGGGLVLDGVPYPGRTGNAGHVGHVVVEQHGELCTCGGRGCVETVASGPWMTRWARANGWSALPSAGAKELADAAATGDPVALQAFRRGAGALAAMIASVAAVCDLDLVVIGGGVAKSGALLLDPLRESLAEYARLDFLAGLRVVPAELGGEAGLVGAAAARPTRVLRESRGAQYGTVRSRRHCPGGGSRCIRAISQLRQRPFWLLDAGRPARRPGPLAVDSTLWPSSAMSGPRIAAIPSTCAISPGTSLI